MCISPFFYWWTLGLFLVYCRTLRTLQCYNVCPYLLRSGDFISIGSFPLVLKHAVIFPIITKHSLHFRHTNSLLPLLSQILERILFGIFNSSAPLSPKLPLVWFLLLPPSYAALCEVINGSLPAKSKGQFLLVLAAAFDSADHTLLLETLHLSSRSPHFLPFPPRSFIFLSLPCWLFFCSPTL